VTKSTVPVGTCAKITTLLREATGRDCDVASNPEFLKEGAAIDDFMKPDRVVVGVRRPEVADVLRQLYEPFLRTEKPFLTMSPESAEMTKYVANAMLATKISFINEMANLCEQTGADVNVQDRAGATPLHVAIELQCFEFGRELVASGADVNKPSQYNKTSLHVAARYGNAAIVRLNRLMPFMRRPAGGTPAG